MEKYFKLLVVALFATMSFAFTSCSSEDEEASALIGTWKLTNIEYGSGWIGNNFDETTFDVIAYTKYNADGTVISVWLEAQDCVVYSESWILQGSTIITDDGEQHINTEYIVSLTDKELILRTDGDKTYWKRVPDSEIEQYLNL